MASAMSSIIRFYEGDEESVNSSCQTHGLSPLEINMNLSCSIQGDYPNNISSSLLLDRVEDFPAGLTTEVFLDEEIENSAINLPGKSISSSITDILYSLSLKALNLARRNSWTRAKSVDAVVVSESLPITLPNFGSAIDVISDSPIEPLFTGRYGNMVDVCEEDDESDIVDKMLQGFVEYVCYQEKMDKGMGSQVRAQTLNDEEESEMANNQELVASPTIIVGSNLNISKSDNPLKPNVVPATYHEESKQTLFENDCNGGDNVSSRISTLSRMRSKTKTIFRQLSTHIENEEKLYEDTIISLKRRFSEIKFGQRPSQRWIWSRKTDSSTIGFPYSNYGSNQNIDKVSDDIKRTSLLELFQSQNFNQRLQEGTVIERKPYPTQNDENVAVDDVIYMPNRKSDDDYYLTKKHQFNLKRSRSIHGIAKQIFRFRSHNELL